MNDLNKKERILDGFTVNLDDKQKELTIRHGEANKIFQYDGIHYNLYSQKSLIAMLQAKGSIANSIIAYSDKGIEVVLNDNIIGRKKDYLSYNYEESLQYKEWFEILKGNKVFTQKELVVFLKHRKKEEIDNYEQILFAISNYQNQTIIDNEHINNLDGNYTCSIKVQNTETTVKIPKTFTAKITYLNETDLVQEVDIDLEITVPTSPNDKLTFTLSCPSSRRYYLDAVENEHKILKEELADYLVVAGKII